jgi:hypothetical protein
MTDHHDQDLSWDSDNVAALRTFLGTSTGEKLFSALHFYRPRLTGATLEQTALRAKLVEGFELAFNALASLAYPPKEVREEVSTTYPPLDSDNHWKTGETK